MRSTISTAAVLLSALSAVKAQTFTDCNPTLKTCPSDPGYGKGNTFFTDFSTSSTTPSGWSLADGTTMTYDSNGANFKIATKTSAPTMSSEKYIMFGNVSTYAKASPGTGIVSSFILESDDLDELDWEWLGSTDTSVESNFFGKGNVTTYDRAIYHPLTKAITGWHTYTIQWTQDYVKWLIDGVEVRNLPFNDPLTHGGTQFPQTPMKIKLGNWVGCADAAAAADPKTQGTCQWAGGPASFDNDATYTMLVKNITIDDAGCGGDYTYTDLTGMYQSIESSNTGSNCGASGSSSSSVSASGSSSATSAASSKASSATSTGTGGVLVETASSVSSSASTATGTGSGSNKSTLTTATAATATGASTANGAASKTTGTASTTSSGLAQVTANAGNVNKPAHKYGALDAAVMVLGLGVGYLVM
ncbi:putative glycosidase crf1 [Lachnellula suecica]|uniref:chitinase n=1 Tax=Lachnellula suecica TaxID=602035 RepID=A0A8T9BW34_9HELO|nr:putative glycosidase crf1 [Lachnellula suecica]